MTISDAGNADAFVETLGGDLIYASGIGWLRWDGRRYRPDTDRARGRMLDFGRQLVREAADIKQDATRDAQLRQGGKLMNLRHADSALTVASLHSDVRRDADQLDADRYLLNVKNGVVDLRNGNLVDHRRDHLMTKCVHIVWNEEAARPRWERFLREVIPDPETRDFLQCAVGYSLTGVTTEEILLLLFGSGGNGKSVFLRALQAITGDYCAQLPEAAILTRGNGVDPERALVPLPGARVAMTTEIGDGRLREETVKMLVSGERTTARRMYKEAFDFESRAKLWLSTNTTPHVRGVDDGIWRRVRRIDFPVSIPESERDRGLWGALQAELPGILAWAVEGCSKWLVAGRLVTPSAVTGSTAEYRQAENPVAQFVEDCCEIDPNANETTADLYTAFRQWADHEGVALRLRSRGFSQFLGVATKGDSAVHAGRVRRERGWHGLRIGRR